MNIGILLFWEVHELEVIGCYSTLKAAQDLLPEGLLQVYTLARSRMSVKTAGGLPLTPLFAFSSTPECDVLIIPGGQGIDRAIKDKSIMSYVGQHLATCERICSIGSGAFILGELGYLRNQNVSGLLEPPERLQNYEVDNVQADKIVKNRHLWTAAARSGALDLGLALVQDLFPEVSEKVYDALYIKH